jgi:hypothetical protein
MVELILIKEDQPILKEGSENYTDKSFTITGNYENRSNSARWQKSRYGSISFGIQEGVGRNRTGSDRYNRKSR